MRSVPFCFLAFALALPGVAQAAPLPVAQSATRPQGNLSERLVRVRDRVLRLEQSLIDGMHVQTDAKKTLQKIQELMKLQREERELGQQRTRELQDTIGALQLRRGQLHERITQQETGIRGFLRDLERSTRGQGQGLARLPGPHDRTEDARRRVLTHLVGRGLREIETLRVDLEDADELERKIQDEQHQLAYLLQDLREQEAVLELNRQLQVDLLQKRHEQRLGQLEQYRKLKTAETRVEGLIRDFNARRELERTIETERVANRSMKQGVFASEKGRLSLPVPGKLIGLFGRAFDPKSNLYVFKKGLDIATQASQSVKAIHAGKVAFSGELPNYGRVAIVDHGDHYYTLCANLGGLSRQTGDAVAAGDELGQAAADGTPVYFEIRSRNIAVNPLQWIADTR
jgi:septal ring factor EnvC (AmiA/AmiB activator)